MTVPSAFVHASRNFERFLLDARDEPRLGTTHQSYAAVLAVLVTFRARLTPAEGVTFANALPPLLGAMFLQGWDMAQPPKPFADRAALTRDVIGHRHDHTLLPETGIADVARAVRRHVEAQAFESALDKLSPGARAFWVVQ